MVYKNIETSAANNPWQVMKHFDQAVAVSLMTMFTDGALILWMWHSIIAEDNEDDESGNVSVASFEEACVSDSYASHESDDDDQDSCNPGSILTHTVCFKCIGVTLDPAYQDTLRKILHNG